jgi:hypothetical protein
MLVHIPEWLQKIIARSFRSQLIFRWTTGRFKDRMQGGRSHKFLMYSKCVFRFNYSVFENLCAANEFWAKPGRRCLAQGGCNAL